MCYSFVILFLQDYTVALKIFEDLLKRDTNNKEVLLCGVGRIFLQVNHINSYISVELFLRLYHIVII